MAFVSQTQCVDRSTLLGGVVHKGRHQVLNDIQAAVSGTGDPKISHSLSQHIQQVGSPRPQWSAGSHDRAGVTAGKETWDGEERHPNLGPQRPPSKQGKRDVLLAAARSQPKSPASRQPYRSFQQERGSLAHAPHCTPPTHSHLPLNRGDTCHRGEGYSTTRHQWGPATHAGDPRGGGPGRHARLPLLPARRPGSAVLRSRPRRLSGPRGTLAGPQPLPRALWAPAGLGGPPAAHKTRSLTRSRPRSSSSVAWAAAALRRLPGSAGPTAPARPPAPRGPARPRQQPAPGERPGSGGHAPGRRRARRRTCWRRPLPAAPRAELSREGSGPGRLERSELRRRRAPRLSGRCYPRAPARLAFPQWRRRAAPPQAARGSGGGGGGGASLPESGRPPPSPEEPAQTRAALGPRAWPPSRRHQWKTKFPGSQTTRRGTNCGRDPGSSRGPQNTLWSTWGPRPGSSRHRVPGRRGHRPPAFARLHANQVTPKNPRGGSARQQREHSRPRRSPTSFIVRPRARVTARSLRSHGAHSRPETRTSRLDAPQSTRLRPQPRPRHGTARRARRRRLMAVLKSRTNVTATLRDVTQVPAPRRALPWYGCFGFSAIASAGEAPKRDAV
uniref:Serine/arginine repetitive matrix protein 2-like n=1 Tax=Castor canadensis TaxID=51338 RepID=A0A8B7U5H4_CASCN|nr:serine/arginine repetitive matrix protein 2-like [Castor canadensis]